jgi:hypothetical protein
MIAAQLQPTTADPIMVRPGIRLRQLRTQFVYQRIHSRVRIPRGHYQLRQSTIQPNTSATTSLTRTAFPLGLRTTLAAGRQYTLPRQRRLSHPQARLHFDQRLQHWHPVPLRHQRPEHKPR